LAGEPLHLLAEHVEQARNPDYAHDPPYPHLPYRDANEKRAALAGC
jgi:hypothetical protein